MTEHVPRTRVPGGCSLPGTLGTEHTVGVAGCALPGTIALLWVHRVALLGSSVLLIHHCFFPHPPQKFVQPGDRD